MRKLNTIQKRNRLNDVYSMDECEHGMHHEYEIHIPCSEKKRTPVAIIYIPFQKGGRNEKDSTSGVQDVDLLEIVRDRLYCASACRENSLALENVELALMWLNRRAEDRAARDAFGKHRK